MPRRRGFAAWWPTLPPVTDDGQRDEAQPESDEELLRRARRSVARRLVVTAPIYVVLIIGFDVIHERSRPPAATREPPVWLPVLLLGVSVLMLIAVVVWLFTKQLRLGSPQVAILAQRDKTRRITAALRRGRPVANADLGLAPHVVASIDRLRRLWPLLLIVTAADVLLLLVERGTARLMLMIVLAAVVVAGVHAWWSRRRVLENATRQGLLPHDTAG